MSGRTPRKSKKLAEPLLALEEEALGLFTKEQQVKIASAEKAVEHGYSTRNYKLNSTTAVRAALASLCCALPVLVPGCVEDPQWVAGLASAVTYACIAISPDFGATVQNAYQCLGGTLFAVAFGILMDLIMPGGAGGQHYWPNCAHAANVVFIVVTLALGFSEKVTMFMLMRHCTTYMEFIDPQATYDRWREAEVTLACAALGVSVAALSMLIPFLSATTLATRLCRESMIGSVIRFQKLMLEMHHYESNNSASVEIFRTQKRLREIRNLIHMTQEHLQGSRWEGPFVDLFRWGAGRRTRERIELHAHLMHRLCDHAEAVCETIRTQNFEGTTHESIMSDPHVMLRSAGLVGKTCALLKKATLNAECDKLDHQMVEFCSKVRKEAKDMAAAYFNKRRDLQPQAQIRADMQTENFYLYSITIVARWVADYADVQRERPAVPGLRHSLRERAEELIYFRRIRSDEQMRSFTFRNALAILICFYVGAYCGAFDADAAATACILLTSYPGAPLTRNIGRLQGVVVANMVPHVLMELAGDTCEAQHICVHVGLFFAYMLLTSYVNFTCKDFGFVAGLAAALGGPLMVTTCYGRLAAGAAQGGRLTNYTAAALLQAADDEEMVQELFSYNKSLQCTLCVFMIMAVDSVLAKKRASCMARDALFRAFVLLEHSVQAVFRKRCDNGHIEGKALANKYYQDRKLRHAYHAKTISCPDRLESFKIHKHLELATGLSAEAAVEIRGHRAPWPTSYFETAIQFCRLLRHDICMIERALQNSGDKYHDIFHKVRTKAQFDQYSADLSALLDKTFEMVRLVLENEQGCDQQKIVGKAIQKRIKKAEGDEPKLISELNKGMQYAEGAPLKTIEDDEASRTMVVCSLLHRISDEAVIMIDESLKYA